MMLFAPLLLLATVSTAYITVNKGDVTNGTTSLQVLALLDQLEVSILDRLATRTNNTVFRQASKVRLIPITKVCRYLFMLSERNPTCMRLIMSSDLGG